MKRKPKPVANTWHVVAIRDWRTRVPSMLTLKETFASKAKANAMARELQKKGPHHSSCVSETHYVVQSPKDIEWKTCKASGMSIPYVKRADLLKHLHTFPAPLARYFRQHHPEMVVHDAK
jgi:hypothetical protein